ncbi:GTP cyclohydrolase II [Alphaproteobacteria bacterium]|nr:GTP cyclohydrolase II [Alphaproteobacteria bacterium]
MRTRMQMNTRSPIERAILDLRQGGVVMIKDRRGQAGLVQAAEFTDQGSSVFEAVGGGMPVLCLTSRHSEMLGGVNPAMPCHTIAIGALKDDEILALILGDSTQLPKHVGLLGEKEGSLPHLACTLLRRAKLVPAAFLVRITHLENNQLQATADTHHITIIDGPQLDSLKTEPVAEMTIAVKAKLPLSMAPETNIVMFRQPAGREEHFAVIVAGENKTETPLVRLHSQCITGDILGSLKCDCGLQLHHALDQMNEEGGGILIYLAQEGRDIGLMNKIRAYALQDKGFDTVDANHKLGFETDERFFGPAAAMLNALGVSRIRLMTNNPEKIEQLSSHGIEVVERVSLSLPSNPHNKGYLKTKQTRTGHMLETDSFDERDN